MTPLVRIGFEHINISTSNTISRSVARWKTCEITSLQPQLLRRDESCKTGWGFGGGWKKPPPAIHAANSSGVRYCRLECGRRRLYSPRYSWHSACACATLPNVSMSRHSRRNVPLNLSFFPFGHGLPGSMWRQVTPASLSRRFRALAINSRPWSDRTYCGAPSGPFSFPFIRSFFVFMTFWDRTIYWEIRSSCLPKIHAALKTKRPWGHRGSGTAAGGSEPPPWH